VAGRRPSGAAQPRGRLSGGERARGRGSVIARRIPTRGLRGLPRLTTVRGRMQLAATRGNGRRSIVDYAHTPTRWHRARGAAPACDGPHRRRLRRGRRPRPGQAPADGARAAATLPMSSSSPTTTRAAKDPAAIRAAVMEGVPRRRATSRVGDRAEAILRGVDALGPGDALLIAGKGHETGQTIGTDRLSLRRCGTGQRRGRRTGRAAGMTAALDRGPPPRPLQRQAGRHGDWQATGRVHRHPHDPAGRSVRRAEGRARRARLRGQARWPRGPPRRLSRASPEGLPADAPLLIVPDVLRALEDLGPGGPRPDASPGRGVTGSVGKTSTKDMLRACCRAGPDHAAEASYNNHWGVPLTLARMPADTDFAVIEIGMNHPGEIAPLARMARPHVASWSPRRPPRISRPSAASTGSPMKRRRSARGWSPAAPPSCHGDIPQTPILLDAAARHGARAITFGEAPGNHHRRTDIASARRGHRRRMAGLADAGPCSRCDRGAPFRHQCAGVLAPWPSARAPTGPARSWRWRMGSPPPGAARASARARHPVRRRDASN
jgi:hypothetical protein